MKDHGRLSVERHVHLTHYFIAIQRAIDPEQSHVFLLVGQFNAN